MDLQFVSVSELLTNHQLDDPKFSCLQSDPARFRLLRVQPRANLTYSIRKGPVVCDEDFDAKCRHALHLARQEYANLVMFPEYCISYKLLEEIVCGKDEGIWPENDSLWCLPCQAIPSKDFRLLLDKLDGYPDVIVLGKNCNYRPNHFINALFYCFVTMQNGNRKLVLLPQLKLHPMSDRSYLCEGNGLSIGNVIYYFKGEEISLLSLICADVFHEEVSIDKFFCETKTVSLLILHPQLNAKPREDAFCHIRREMMDRNSACTYIACNWAAETVVFPEADADDGGNKISIPLSWSCIYQKYNKNANPEQIVSKMKSLQLNLQKGMCVGIASVRRTLVWITDSCECLHILEVAAPYSTNYAAANDYDPLRADERCVFSTSMACWEPAQYSFAIEERIKETEDLSHLVQVLDEHWNSFPLNTPNKYALDHFFALVACREYGAFELDGDKETLHSWSLLLDKNDAERAEKELSRFVHLIHSLKNHLPPHLHSLRDAWEFTYLPQSNGLPPANLKERSQNGMRLIVAYANTQGEAKAYLKHLCNQFLPESKDKAGRYICIFYPTLSSTEVGILPKPQNHITDGNEFKTDERITDGGS